MTINLDPTDITCNGLNNGEIVVNILDSTGLCNYEWNGPDGDFTSPTEIITGLKPGNYTVTVTDSNYPESCEAITNIEIFEPEILDVDITIQDKYCEGSSPIDPDLALGKINADGIGGTPNYNYEWTGPGGPYYSDYITKLEPGEYILTLTDENGCDTIKSVLVESSYEYNLQNLSVEIDDPAVCWYEPVEIRVNYDGQGTADSVYIKYSEFINGRWEGEFRDTIPISGEPATFEKQISNKTIIERYVITNDFCKDEVIVRDTIEFFPSFNLDILDYDNRPADDTLEIKGATQGELTAMVSDETGLSFDWSPSEWLSSPGSKTTIVKPDDSGIFTVVVTSDDGCVDSSSIYVLYIPAIKPQKDSRPMAMV